MKVLLVMVKCSSFESNARCGRDDLRDERRMAEFSDEQRFQSGCHDSDAICTGRAHAAPERVAPSTRRNGSPNPLRRIA
jgi:hypothetical protein